MRWFPVIVLVPALSGTLLADPTAVRNLSEYAKGLYAQHEGDITEARQHFETTLEADPDSFTVANKTAMTQLSDSDMAAASGTLRGFANAHGEQLDPQLYYADFLNQNAPHDDMARKVAIETLEGANMRFPHQHDVFSRLINLYENGEQSEKSLALFREQFDAPDASAFHWMSLAPIARTLLPDDAPELPERLDLIAEKTAETGIAIPQAARSVSDYYRKSNRLAEAIVILEKHIAAVPSSLALRTRLGLLMLAAKRDEDAERHLLETIQIDPEQVLAHRALAKFYQDRGNIDKSLHHRAEALKISGGHPSEFLELANEYLDNDQPHPARLLLEKARFEHPDDPGIAARLAIATLRDGDTSGANLLFRQAEALAKESKDPEATQWLDADFQFEFAGSLRDAGDLAAAESRLRAAAKSSPADNPLQKARALRELARNWLDQDKNQGPAVSLLRSAESLDPGNPETAALLQRAKGGK